MKRLLITLLWVMGYGQAHEPFKLKTFTLDGISYQAAATAAKNINLHWKDSHNKPYRNMISLKNDLLTKGIKPMLIMNAGIYSSNENPAGLHIEKGQKLKTLNTNKGKGNFHLQPNGVFFITQQNKADILTTTAYQKYIKDESQIRLATQSGPMLLINGKINSKFIKNSPSVYHRNGICVDDQNHVFSFISQNKSNLYQFASAAAHLGCVNALYLDGTISKMYVAGQNSIFHFSPFVGLLSISENKVLSGN